MEYCVLFTVVAACLANCQGAVNTTDYIMWKKTDITAWHQFFPSRSLEEERLTIISAMDAVRNMSRSLPNDLSKIVAFQQKELETAQMVMAGTDAEGCVSGISGFINKSISDEFAAYSDCSADALPRLSRLNNTLARMMDKYMSAFKRAMKGIDICARTYPNKDFFPRLKSCVESMNSDYFSAANATKAALKPSPSMSYFQNTLVKCARDAAVAVADKGFQFLKMLVECSRLSGSVDADEYAQEMSQWKGYNDTLAEQVLSMQSTNDDQISSIEQNMKTYYQMQKQALEQYAIEPRGLDYYLRKIYSVLSNYYNTITETAMDNPGDATCGTAAKQALDAAAFDSANKSLVCDFKIVVDSKARIYAMYQNFSQLNILMPYSGDVAILSCFTKGYIYAPNTITDCSTLIQTLFNVETQDINTTINKDLSVLSSYLSNLPSDSDSPCGGTSKQRLMLSGQFKLYQLQRCLYESSGTTYSVTTPTPIVTATSTDFTTPDTTTAQLE